jgi:adenosylhomocysteine nucleosidase
MGTPAAMMDAVAAGDTDRVAALLAEDPSLATARGADGVSALLLARYRFDRPTMDALLAADPDLDVFEAAALGRIDRLRERLADDPGSVAAMSPDGFTALHLAAFFGKTEVTRILLAAGARVDTYTTNDFANQPLHAAAAGRHIEVCRLLLAAGADVDATQHGGFTPLHEAAQAGDAELVELFLSAGADPTITVEDGSSPADLAEKAGHHDVATRLREVADTNQR